MHAKRAKLGNQTLACPADIEDLLQELEAKVSGEGYIPVRQRYAEALALYWYSGRRREHCELGHLLPLAAWAASLSCHARRDASVHEAVRGAVEHMQRVGDPVRYLQMGRYAAVLFSLLHATLDAFKGPLREPLLVSYDPLETKYHAKGIDVFAHHAFNESDFRVVPGVPCAPVWLARDALLSHEYTGVRVYVDQEAGLSTGRQVGSLEWLNKPSVLYLGVRDPMAATRCAPNTGTQQGSMTAQGIPLVCVHVQTGVTAAAASTGIPIPFASSSFMERTQFQPSSLATTTRSLTDTPRRPHAVAYFASTCVTHRELLFDMLVEQLGAEARIDALGRCHGTHPERSLQNKDTRRADGFMDEAVRMLQGYKFAIAFENKHVNGYVTEKIVNAFLAGAVPIFWGSDAVLDMFNEEAFVFANRFMPSPQTRPLDGLHKVVAEVKRLLDDPAAFSRMASVPVLSRAQLDRWFSWHHSVGSAVLRRQIRHGVLCRLGGEVTEETLCPDGLTLCSTKRSIAGFRAELCSRDTAGS